MGFTFKFTFSFNGPIAEME